MYVYNNDTIAYEINFCAICKYKWIVEGYKKENEKWVKTGHYKRFEHLEEAREYAKDKLKKFTKSN